MTRVAILRPWPELEARTAERSATEPAGTLRFVRDPLRLVLFTLTVLNVSRLHEAFPLLGRLRPALILVILAAGYAFLYSRALTSANIFSYWPMRRIAALGVLACLSAAFGLSLGGSASFILAVYSKTLLFCFLLALGIRDARDLYTLVWAYAVSCGVLAFFSMFVFGLSSGGGGLSRLGSLYTYDANDICVVMVVGLAAVLLLLQVAKGLPRAALVLILAGIGATFARSGSRGGFLGLVVFGAAALVLVNNVSVVRRGSLLLIVAVALAAFAPDGYWDQMRTVLAPKDDYNFSSVDGRKALMTRGIGYMASYPVFGIGIDNFWRAECNISGEAVGNGGIRCGAPHNSYVEVGSELGVPGLLVWASIVLSGIVALLKLRRRLPRAWRRGTSTERFLYSATHFFALGALGFAVTSFFVSFAWMDVLYVLAAYITGLYISLRAHLASIASAGPGTESGVPVLSRRMPGWRVAASAQRIGVARHPEIQTGTA